MLAGQDTIYTFATDWMQSWSFANPDLFCMLLTVKLRRDWIGLNKAGALLKTNESE